jgi:hypothetical protein
VLDSLRAAARRFENCDAIDVGARMVFALFLVSTWVTTEVWYFKLPLRALALAALVLPPIHRDPRLWTMFAALLFCKSIRNWMTQDNHIFLLTWFSIGMSIALRARDPERTVCDLGRRLIGLTFFFAALWKGPLSGEFMDGTFYAHAFLTDDRFRGSAQLFAGVPFDTLMLNASEVTRLEAGADAVVLQGVTTRLMVVARIAAWWTFLLEAALAVTCFVPEAWSRVRASRHGLLLLFGLTTYLVVDIETFGWTLMAIGAAQTAREEHVLRALYFITCVVILAYDYVPILEWIAMWLS